MPKKIRKKEKHTPHVRSSFHFPISLPRAQHQQAYLRRKRVRRGRHCSPLAAQRQTNNETQHSEPKPLQFSLQRSARRMAACGRQGARAPRAAARGPGQAHTAMRLHHAPCCAPPPPGPTCAAAAEGRSPLDRTESTAGARNTDHVGPQRLATRTMIGFVYADDASTSRSHARGGGLVGPRAGRGRSGAGGGGSGRGFAGHFEA